MEPDAFPEFVAARSPSLVRFAWLLTGDWSSAEDLLQTALAQAWRHWRRLDEAGAEAYVRTCLVRAHVSRWRRRSAHEVVVADTSPAAVGDGAGTVDLRRDLVSALRRLPPRQRAVVVLRYYGDLGEDAVAQILGCSVGTVKSQAAKALAHLRADADMRHLWTGEPSGRT